MSFRYWEFYELSGPKEPSVMYNIKDSYLDTRNKLSKNQNLNDLSRIDFFNINKENAIESELNELSDTD